MKNLILFIMSIITFAGCSSSNTSKATTEHHFNAINQCINTYEVKSNKKLPKAIDRVSILEHKKILDLLFVKGEMGTFGKRDVGYTSYFVCRTIGKEVTFLQAGYKILVNKSHQESEDIVALDTYVEKTGAKDVMEYSYQKQEDGFALSDQQVFSVDNIGW